MTTQMEFEFQDLGVEFSDYFQGFGCAYTEYQYAFTGCGSSEMEAAEDALDAACGALHIPDDAVARMEAAISLMCWTQDAIDEDAYHYVGLLLDKTTANQEEERFLIETYGEVK